MHDHDDPKKCKVCSALLDQLAELGEFLEKIPSTESIAGAVQQHCEEAA